MTKVQTLIEEILINNAEGSYARRLALEAHMEINNDLKVIVRVPGFDTPFLISEKDFSEICAFVRAGQPINGIKIFRTSTGVGLKEAKDAVVDSGQFGKRLTSGI